MSACVRQAFAIALACLTSLVLASGALSGTAYAAVSTVRTATVTPSYANPVTGEIEDAGGAASQALGESMVTSATKDRALVEIDSSGDVFVTLRIGLIDQINGVSVECSSDGGESFSAVESMEMQRDTSHGEASPDNTVDVRFRAPSESCVMRLKLDVIPMGREVVYFAQLSDFADGNLAGFVQTVDSGSVDRGDAVDGGAPSTSSAAAPQGSSASSGVTGYDADGNDVTGGAQVEPLDGSQIIVIVGVAAAVVLVVGAAVYAVYVRPKRAREAAAAACAGPPKDDDDLA